MRSFSRRVTEYFISVFGQQGSMQLGLCWWTFQRSPMTQKPAGEGHPSLYLTVLLPPQSLKKICQYQDHCREKTTVYRRQWLEWFEARPRLTIVQLKRPHAFICLFHLLFEKFNYYSSFTPNMVGDLYAFIDVQFTHTLCVSARCVAALYNGWQWRNFNASWPSPRSCG